MEYWAQKPVEVRAIEALGKGFDLSSDFRLKYAKGMSSNNERLVLLDETNKRDVVFPGGLTISNVSEDIRCDKGDRTRYKSDVLEFNQVRFCIFFFFFQLVNYCMVSYINFLLFFGLTSLLLFLLHEWQWQICFSM